MGDDDLLLTHASRWAEAKKRPFDAELIATILELRRNYDARSPGSWPTGAAEQLVLVRWPSHGPLETPEPDALADSLETWWRFLRGTGRMSSGSAEPGALIKELRRALPRRAETVTDRSNWGLGRVLTDFGADIGIDLSMSQSPEELQDKLAALMEAWNSLPADERAARMPDPSPKTAAGVGMTHLVNATDEPSGGLVGLGIRRGDPVVSARQARDADFTRACLRLADWVGQRKEVTSIGVLRPAVAREAYDELDLFAWDRAHSPAYANRHARKDLPEEAWEVRRASEPHSWTSAADCEALDRLWQACCAAGLIDVQRTVARRTDHHPKSDEQWLELGLRLVVGLVGRGGSRRFEVVLGALTLPQASDDGEIALAALKQWWLDRKGYDRLVASHGEEGARVFHEIYTDEVDRMLHSYHDTGVWTGADGWLTLTEFGRDVAGVLAQMRQGGWFEQW